MKMLHLFCALIAATFLLPGTLQARWMNPRTGRFLTLDTFEGQQDVPPSLHKYLYCEDDPINVEDRDGHEADVAEVLNGVFSVLGPFAPTPSMMVERPTKLLKWAFKNNSTSAAGLRWWFSYIFQYRITDQLDRPIVGRLVTEVVIVNDSRRAVSPKPVTGNARTDKDGVVRDNHIWTFWAPAGWVDTTQIVSVEGWPNLSVTLHETDYATGNWDGDYLAHFHENILP
jgi:hypothetical protein